MKSKQTEVERGDGANIINVHDVHDSATGAECAGTAMAPARQGQGQRARRARWLAALAAVLAYLLLLLYVKAQYLQVRRLDRLLQFEKDSDELLKNLELLDQHMSMRLDRLAALHRL